MKPTIADIIELAGWAALCVGLWQYDYRVALAVVGGLVVIVALMRKAVADK